MLKMFRLILSSLPQTLRSSSIFVLTATFVFFGLTLSSCSTTPPQTPETDRQKSATQPINATAEHIRELETKIQQAKFQKNWENYLSLSQQLWQNASESNQLSIEYLVWQTLKHIPEEKRQTLGDSQNTSAELSDWLAFVEATEQAPIWQKPTLEELKTFNPSAMYNRHLNTAISEQLLVPKPVHNIAVMLPLAGPYQNIAMQIRNGIIRNQLTNAPGIKLTFYNTNPNGTSSPEQMDTLYQTAKQNGADIIIGPLQKENIERLSHFNDKSIIALNDAFDIPHFNFNSNSEALQITKKLCQQHYKNIAILTSSTSADSSLAVQIAEYWQQSSNHKLALKTYPAQHPKLREALGSVINETQSQARKANLQWLLKENLSFSPRTRKDLDAIVLLGNSRQVAVFKPQFAFFELQLPVYGSAKLTPVNLDKTPPNKDLANVIFPSFSAALKPTQLSSKLEAFGWDSFTLATKQYLLGPNVCMNGGMTGRLSKQDNEFDYQLSWAKYNQKGVVVPLPRDEMETASRLVSLPETLDGLPDSDDSDTNDNGVNNSNNPRSTIETP